MYIRYIWLFWPTFVVLTCKIAFIVVVALVTLQLKVGLYSKSIVYTASPSLGTVVKVLSKARAYDAWL